MNNPSVREHWEESFGEQRRIAAFNTAPVEAVVRTIAYYLRHRASAIDPRTLRFVELGCGAGSNLVWIARRGIRVSGVDISPTALDLARAAIDQAGVADRLEDLAEASVASVPFDSETFDGVIEACVFQHLAQADRARAFAEVRRLLKPGGVFVGYMLDVGHTVFQAHRAEQMADDPGTLMLADSNQSRVHLTNIGLSHFYRREEIIGLLDGFSVVDPCATSYALPGEEAERRGYREYVQSMWTVYAIK